MISYLPGGRKTIAALLSMEFPDIEFQPKSANSSTNLILTPNSVGQISGTKARLSEGASSMTIDDFLWMMGRSDLREKFRIIPADRVSSGLGTIGASTSPSSLRYRTVQPTYISPPIFFASTRSRSPSRYSSVAKPIIIYPTSPIERKVLATRNSSDMPTRTYHRSPSPRRSARSTSPKSTRQSPRSSSPKSTRRSASPKSVRPDSPRPSRSNSSAPFGFPSFL